MEITLVGAEECKWERKSLVLKEAIRGEALVPCFHWSVFPFRVLCFYKCHHTRCWVCLWCLLCSFFSTCGPPPIFSLLLPDWLSHKISPPVLSCFMCACACVCWIWFALLRKIYCGKISVFKINLLSLYILLIYATHSMVSIPIIFFNSLLCLHSFNSCLSACLCQVPAGRSWCCWLNNWMCWSPKSKRKGRELSREGSLRWILKPAQELPWRFKSRGCVVFIL